MSNGLKFNDTKDTSCMQTPIEIALQIDDNGMTTARNLYEFLGLAPTQFARWSRVHIENNEFYEENTDWVGFDIMSNGNSCKDYRVTTDFAKHLCMESHSEKGKIARQYFIKVEDKAKEMVINRSKLSPQMQMFYAIADGQARIELEQKRQAEQIQRVEQRQQVLSETFEKSSDNEDFKVWCKQCIKKIADSGKFCHEHYLNTRYRDAWNESYERLSEKRACRLRQRVDTARRRAEKNGATAEQISEITYLSVISEDKDLKPVYEMVIKEMMICYCVK